MHRCCTTVTVGMLTEDAKKCNGLLQWYSNCVSQNPGDPRAFSGVPRAYFLDHETGTINLFASGFKWLQSTFVYDILFARHLNFSTWFTKNVNILGTKKD